MQGGRFFKEEKPLPGHTTVCINLQSDISCLIGEGGDITTYTWIATNYYTLYCTITILYCTILWFCGPYQYYKWSSTQPLRFLKKKKKNYTQV